MKDLPTRRPAALLLGAALLAAAAAQAQSGLGSWCESRTADFQLVSDLDQHGQQALLDQLAWFEPVAEPFLPGQPVAHRAPLKLIVFSRRSDFRALTGKRKFAGFMQPSLQTNRLLIGPVRGGLTETALHEYAHYLVRNRLDVSLPVWFDEGLASLLGATRFTGDTARIGALPAEQLRQRVRYEVDGEAPARALNRTLKAHSVETWSQKRINAFYDWSWLLTHYLYFDRLDGQPINESDLAEFLNQRTSGLLAHLGQHPQSLIRALDRYLRKPPPALIVPLDPSRGKPASFRCLDALARDHELAQAVLDQNPASARALLAPHLRKQPENSALLITLARAELAAGDLDESRRLSQQARRLAPNDARTAILSADLLVYNCLFGNDENCMDRWHQATPLYRGAIRQAPDRFDAVLGLGLAYLYTGRAGESVNYLKVAYARAPWAAVTNFYLGESYRLVGDSRAFGYLQNARNWASQPVWRILAEESLRLLEAATGTAGTEAAGRGGH